MKRFWHTCLAVIASATMTAGVANAQNDWNVPSEIGSYQSILSRAGYGNGSPATTGRAVGSATSNLSGSGTSNNGGLLNGGLLNGGLINGGMTQGGSGTVNGGMINGGMTNGSMSNGGMINGGMTQGGSGTVNGGMINGGMTNGGMTNGSMSSGGMINGGMTQAGSGTVNGGMINGGMSNGGFVNGGMTNGGMTNGGFVNGGVVNGGMVTGEVVNGGGMQYNGSASSIVGPAQPIMTQPRTTVMAQPTMAAPVVGQPYSSGGAIVDNGFAANGGNVYNGVVNNNVGYINPGYSSGGVVGGGVSNFISPGIVSGAVGGGRARSSNFVVGVTGLFFRRDTEDGVLLSRNPRGDQLFTSDANDDLDGYGVTVARRKCNGRGIQLNYWALNESSTARLDGDQVAAQLPTFGSLTHLPSDRDVLSIYSTGLFHTVTRRTDINNFEANLLNNGGYYKTRRGRSAQFELIGGFRYFQFDERLAFTSRGDVNTFPLATESFTYQSEVSNDLLGFQLGARNELCLSKRLRGFFGVTSGIYNNRINTRQRFFDANGAGAVLPDGRDYDFSDQKDDVAFLSEINAGMTYQIGRRMRARIGYRAVGVAGVALAADQIPVDFTRTDRVQRANSNGSLLLHGVVYGMEFCF